jgi:hypothetical protein
MSQFVSRIDRQIRRRSGDVAHLLSNEKKLVNLIDFIFPETSKPYHIEIDRDYLDSLHSPSSQEDNQEEEGEGGRSTSYTPCK